MNSALQIPALNFKMFPLWMFYYSILYAFLYFPNFLHEILSVFHNQEKHFLKCSFHCPAWGKKKKIHDEEQYKTSPHHSNTEQIPLFGTRLCQLKETKTEPYECMHPVLLSSNFIPIHQFVYRII